MKERIISLDVMKFIAIFLVLNSHLDVCYPKYSFLATGGAIGDALFFFVSGFTIFISRKDRFSNWYKRRITRIYLPVITTAVIAYMCFDDDWMFSDVIFLRGYWFLPCILAYYPILYLMSYCNKLQYIFIYSLIVIYAIFFCFYDFTNSGLIYGGGTFRLIFFFIFMLEGAIIGKYYNKLKYKSYHFILLIIFTILWFSSVYLLKNTNIQIISILFLVGMLYYLFNITTITFFEKKYISKIVFIISSLCLECYLVQKYIITDYFNYLFPINLLIISLITLGLAYLVKILTNIIDQTLSLNPYNWEKIFKL